MSSSWDLGLHYGQTTHRTKSQFIRIILALFIGTERQYKKDEVGQFKDFIIDQIWPGLIRAIK